PAEETADQRTGMINRWARRPTDLRLPRPPFTMVAASLGAGRGSKRFPASRGLRRLRQLARLVDPVVTRDAPAEVEALVEGRDLFVSQRSDLPEVEYSSRIECRFELGTDTRDGLEIIRAALRSGEQNVFERLAL